MNKSIMFVGLDVHKEKINVAVADTEGEREVRSYGPVNGTSVAVEKMLRKYISIGKIPKVVYEAGPTGFALQRSLTQKNIDCVVVAPSLIPKKSGDRVKTDRRDAVSLARLHRAGELSPIYVPQEKDEAMRDLTRARVDANIAYRRARQLLLSLLLRNGIYYTGKSNWTPAHLNWISRINLPHQAQQIVFQEYLHAIEETRLRHERLVDQIRMLSQTWSRYPLVQALQALRGVSLIVASGVVSELGDIKRFDSPRQLYSFLGLVPSEYSSGINRRQGSITKCGNTHARWLLTEAAWAYQKGPKMSPIIRRRQQNLPQHICEIAWRAQIRCTKKYRHMVNKGKNPKLAITAVARELTGFMWEIARAI
ncbi:IS110 family transposase [bacterium F11]|nr:IS110 family transposase [bacterium F11]